jgi:hypothetical protein
MKLALVITAVLATTPALAAPTAKDRAASAEKVYRSTSARLKAGAVTVEVVYQWSVRWLDAELAAKTKTALADHLARMQELETAMAKARDAGVAHADDAEAATYFRIEAEIWQARGKR